MPRKQVPTVFIMNISISKITIKRSFFKKLSLPVWTIDSGKPGPILLVTAAQHGNEVQGAVAIYRFINEYSPSVTVGKVIAVPFCNIPAVRQHRPHLNMRCGQPYGDDRGHNMNRNWGGDEKKNSTGRIAIAIYETCGKEATHVLDLHCWQKHNSPAILLHGVPKHRELAEKLGVQFIEMRPISEKTLAGKFCTDGRIGITYEAAGQYDIDDEQVELALNVIRNMAYEIGISGVGEGECGRKPETGSQRPVIFSDKSTVQEIVAPVAGLFIPEALKLGQAVVEDQVLGVILSDTDLESVVIRAPVAGYLKRFGVSRSDCDVDMGAFHPYVSRRDLLAVIAS